MKYLTIIMPYLNEGEESKLTIDSIYQTVNRDLIDIIAINDHSNKPSPIPIRKEIKHIINSQRLGVDASRQIGINESKTPYIFIIDAHLRFPQGWYEELINCIEREPKTAWCTSCMQLGYGNMDLNQSKVEYTGATLLFVDKNAKPDRPAREILEPKWLGKKPELEYEIPCILGANYLFSKEWIDHIKGLEGLKMWGTSEPFLSLKSWMAGGKCKITRKVKIGHKFRDVAPYSTQVWTMVYNKIYLCKTLLPDDICNKLINYMPHNINFNIAMDEIGKNKDVIESQKKYYKSIIKVPIEDICKKFNIQLP